MTMTLSYFADIDPVSNDDCVLHAAPLSHGSGLYELAHVARGAVSIVPHSGGVDGTEIVRLLQRWGSMTFFAAPTMVKRLVEDPAVAAADLSNLKTVSMAAPQCTWPTSKPPSRCSVPDSPRSTGRAKHR
jgi:long-chain acyl-CoA synthetase